MRKYMLVYAILGIGALALTGCGKSEQEQNLRKGDIVQISVKKEVSPQIRINIEKEIEISNADKYRFQIFPYDISEEQYKKIVSAYLGIDESVDVVEEEQNGVKRLYVQDREWQFNAMETGLYFSRDKIFTRTIDYYYKGTGLYPFYKDDLEEYYDHADLPFLSYAEAEQICENLLNEIGYPYDKEKMEAYSLSEEALIRYREGHLDEFSKREKEYEERGVGKLISDWRDRGGAYVFYYPLKIENMEIDMETVTSMLLHAEIVINRSGIAKMYISPAYTVEKREEISVVRPEEVLDKAVKMYENLLYDKVEVVDIELVFTQTSIENIGGTELDAGYILSPVWKVRTLVDEKGETITYTMRYDAETGRQIF